MFSGTAITPPQGFTLRYLLVNPATGAKSMNHIIKIDSLSSSLYSNQTRAQFTQKVASWTSMRLLATIWGYVTVRRIKKLHGCNIFWLLKAGFFFNPHLWGGIGKTRIILTSQMKKVRLREEEWSDLFWYFFFVSIKRKAFRPWLASPVS